MKEFLEGIFSRTSIKPVYRTKIGTNEIFIADGFVEADRFHILQSTFPSAVKGGKEGRDEFPNGCWATLWLTPGKIATRGGIRTFGIGHDQQNERIKQIVDDATEELTRTTH